MINFPIFEKLEVKNYGLYPGASAESGLFIDFKQGLTLVIGANGLGKSTLVHILYRLLTGTFDIPNLDDDKELGSRKLEPTQLPFFRKETFGKRVVDGARDAKAALSLRIGNNSVVIERQLHDLTLTDFTINGQTLGLSERDDFQAEICRLTGVGSFGDWILLLRYIAFYSESRRSLVWDASAQRQILRFLFLPEDKARKWTDDERAILELDSRMRNLSAALFKETQFLTKNERKAQDSLDVRKELQTLKEFQEIDFSRRAQLEEESLNVESSRDQASLRLMTSEQEYEAKSRELERAKLIAIETRFPDKSETARYILAHLLTEDTCLVCDHEAHHASVEYNLRIQQKKCVICGTDLSITDGLVPASDVADKRVESNIAGLRAAEIDLNEAKQEFTEADQRYQSHFTEIHKLKADISQRSQRIDSLIKKLPPEEAKLHEKRTELGTLRSLIESQRIELSTLRQNFRSFIEEASREIVSQSESVKMKFNEYAGNFLLESCDLIWSPQKNTVGQTGESIEFPAFELNMTGSNFPSPMRRNGPEQVSESQREFIDLSFRMALMHVAGQNGVGSLVIDAPESSLDAIFVDRAAQVLASFADPALDNRLLITSNLVDGNLIPKLIEKTTTPSDRSARIVNLFDIAVPTAAVRQYREEYDNLFKKLIADAQINI